MNKNDSIYMWKEIVGCGVYIYNLHTSGVFNRFGGENFSVLLFTLMNHPNNTLSLAHRIMTLPLMVGKLKPATDKTGRQLSLPTISNLPRHTKCEMFNEVPKH
jgi:hypothetical protein